MSFSSSQKKKKKKKKKEDKTKTKHKSKVLEHLTRHLFDGSICSNFEKVLHRSVETLISKISYSFTQSPFLYLDTLKM